MNTFLENPYVGPRTFLREEGHLFFGRDREARDLLSLVVSEQLVLFYAQSGAGKSSLINTRLIPSLEAKSFQVLPVGRVSGDAHAGIPADNPYIFNLLHSLVQKDIDMDILSGLRVDQFLVGLKQDETGFFYDGTDGAPSSADGIKRRALIIDQFEELFSTHPEAWKKREDFFNQVCQAMESDPYLWVVLVMREDYIAYLDPYAHLLPNGLRVRYYMQRLGWDAALKAVRSPVEKRRPFAPGVAEKLVENLASIKVRKPDGDFDTQPGQYVEPVQLQVVCYSLWQNLVSSGPQITEDDLREVGDVNQSLEKFYDGRVVAVARAKNTEERLIREWFDNELITTGGIRNMVLQGQANAHGGLEDTVIQALQGDLVRAEMRAGQIWYELSHDRLIEPIKSSNAKWFAANLSIFQQQAALWVTQGRPEGLLLRGSELEQAERDAKSKTITRDEADFLANCIQARNREKRERRGNLITRILVIVTTIMMIVAFVLGVQASNVAKQAETARAAAQTAEAVAVQAKSAVEAALRAEASANGYIQAEALAGQALIALREFDTVHLGQLLAVKAYKTNKASGNILPSVYQALYDSSGVENDLGSSPKPFASATFNPGTTIEWLTVDNSLWDLEDTEISPLDIESGRVIQSAVQSDEYVTMITEDRYYSDKPYAAYVVDTATKDVSSFSLYVSGFEPHGIDLTTNGRWILAYGVNYNVANGVEKNNGIRLWDVLHPEAEPKDLAVGESLVIKDAAMTSDATTLAVVDDKYLYFWTDDKKDLIPGSKILNADFPLEAGFSLRTASFSGKGGNGLEFSPDGKLLALLTATNIRIFSTGDKPALIAGIPIEKTEVTGFRFSPDSQSLLYVMSSFRYCSSNVGKSCQPRASTWRWSAAKPEAAPSEIYSSNTTDITAMNISSNGILVIGDQAGYVRAWDLNTTVANPPPLQVAGAHAGEVTQLLIAADGQTILSASEEDGTRLWKLEKGATESVIVNRITNTVSNVIRSLDGSTLVIGGINTENRVGNVHVYTNLQTPNNLVDLPLNSQSGSSLEAMAVSQEWVAAGRTDRYASPGPASFLDLWMRKADATTTLFKTFSMPSTVSSLAFRSDGRYLAIATSSGDIWLNDTTTLSPLLTSAVSGSDASTEESSPTPLPGGIQLANDFGNVPSLTMTQDGKYLIGASVNEVRIWDLFGSDQRSYIELPNAAFPVLLSPGSDQKWLVTAGLDNSVQIFDLKNITTAQTIVLPADKSSISRFAFSSDGGRLAIGYRSGKIAIYEMTSNQPELEDTLRGPSSEITSLEFKPIQPNQAVWLVAGSQNVLYLWNLAGATGKPIILQGYQGSVVYAGFSNDGAWIVTAATDQTLRFWSTDLDKISQTACKYAGRNLTRSEWSRYFPKIDYTEENAIFCPEYGLEQVSAEPTRASLGTPTPVRTLEFKQPPTSTPTPSLIFVAYTVQAGDSLLLIAGKFNIPLATLLEDNHLDQNNYIFPGQVLQIRTTSTPPPP